MLVKSKSSDDPSVAPIRSLPPATLTRRLLDERIARYRRERRSRDGTPDGIGHDCRAPYRPNDFGAVHDADVVHLHWTSNFLDWPTVLPWLAKQKPLVWTLHDMNPFLGALHYRDFKSPLPTAFAKWEASLCRHKASILRDIPVDRVRIIAPSLWMKKEAERSELMSRFEVDHIPNGVDGTLFHHMGDRECVRHCLRIPHGKIVVGFVAQNISEKRKGFAVLIDALGRMDVEKQRILLLIAGGNAPAVQGIESIHLGSFDNERLMNLFYNALDIFVCPSLADNLPNTVLEAMSCGVPTVAFETGGLPDMVLPGQTGWLATPIGDPVALADRLDRAVEEIDGGCRYGSRCTQVASLQYSLAQQATAMNRVYCDLTGDTIDRTPTAAKRTGQYHE